MIQRCILQEPFMTKTKQANRRIWVIAGSPNLKFLYRIYWSNEFVFTVTVFSLLTMCFDRLWLILLASLKDIVILKSSFLFGSSAEVITMDQMSKTQTYAKSHKLSHDYGFFNFASKLHWPRKTSFEISLNPFSTLWPCRFTAKKKHFLVPWHYSELTSQGIFPSNAVKRRSKLLSNLFAILLRK